jgi:hypothetical protein
MRGDLTNVQYVMRRQALQDELERLEPAIDPKRPRVHMGSRRTN